MASTHNAAEPALPAEDRYYSVRHAAGLMDVTPVTIKKLVKGGQLKAVKLNARLVRIPATEIRKLQLA